MSDEEQLRMALEASRSRRTEFGISAVELGAMSEEEQLRMALEASRAEASSAKDAREDAFERELHAVRRERCAELERAASAPRAVGASPAAAAPASASAARAPAT